MNYRIDEFLNERIGKSENERNAKSKGLRAERERHVELVSASTLLNKKKAEESSRIG